MDNVQPRPSYCNVVSISLYIKFLVWITAFESPIAGGNQWRHAPGHVTDGEFDTMRHYCRYCWNVHKFTVFDNNKGQRISALLIGQFTFSFIVTTVRLMHIGLRKIQCIRKRPFIWYFLDYCKSLLKEPDWWKLKVSMIGSNIVICKLPEKRMGPNICQFHLFWKIRIVAGVVSREKRNAKWI